MPKNIDEMLKNFAGTSLEERQAYRRLKDIIQKYRAIFQFFSGHSKLVEERLANLMRNREEVRTEFETLQMSLRITQAKIKRVAADVLSLGQKMDSLVGEYDALLAGKLPARLIVEKGGGDDIMKKKELFMERLAGAFAEIEKKTAEVAAGMEKLKRIKSKLSKSADALAEKAKIEETKLSLYQGNIRDLLLEMQNEEANLLQISEEYAEITRLINSAKDVSPLGMKIFKDAVKRELAGGAGILELSNAQTPNTIQLH